MSETTLTVTLEGEHATPTAIHARDVAELLNAVEQLVVGSAASKANANGGFEPVRVSLVGLHKGSLVLEFALTSSERQSEQTVEVFDKIQQGLWNAIPFAVLDAVNTVSRIAGRYKVIATLRGPRIMRDLVIDPAVPTPTPLVVQGNTTLYGEIVHLGGAEPKVGLRLVLNGALVVCNASREVVQALGSMIYRQVSVTGLAAWAPLTQELVDFTIHTFGLYAPAPADEAFAVLRERYGHYFDEINDVDGWVASQRDGTPLHDNDLP